MSTINDLWVCAAVDAAAEWLQSEKPPIFAEFLLVKGAIIGSQPNNEQARQLEAAMRKSIHPGLEVVSKKKRALQDAAYYTALEKILFDFGMTRKTLQLRPSETDKQDMLAVLVLA